MSDSNSPVVTGSPPATSEAASKPPRDVAAPQLAFADTDGAKRWANGLPLTNVAQLFEAVLGQLRALSAAKFPPRERATIAEVLREQVAYLHTELARRYAGKPQPAVDRELEAADQAIAMWHALWEQYSACLKPLLEGDPDLAGVRSKLLQRGLYVGKQLVIVYGLARRIPPPTLWHELHAYYRLAELLECGVTAVSDDLMPNAIGISCYSTFTHALLLGLADPCSMSVKQIELTDRWLGMWSRKVFPYAQQRETEGPIILVDLDGSGGATLALSAPTRPPASMRFGYPGKLATSVRGRLKRLQGGAGPAELQLGIECSVEQCATLLAHLDLKWYHAARRSGGAPRTTVDLCGGGVNAAYFRIGGRTFDRKDPLGRMSFQGAQHLQTLAALTDYDRGREEAEATYAWEQWGGHYEWAEAAVTRTQGTQHHWALDQVVTLRDEERVRLGYVTRVAQDANGEFALSLKLWPGSARAMAVRPLSTAVNEDPPLPMIMLGETPEERASLILPPRSFNSGRVLRSLDAGPERRLRLTRLLHRGADFERVEFEESL
jgi:cyclic-di-GMP-binding protein